jgi:4-hydroxy-2-oxoheptanedioate aldolase
MRLINNFQNSICSVGTFSKCADPAMIECIGLAGFDFVVIDLEHGPNSFETAQDLVRAAVIHNLTPVIRVGENNESMISKALDIGARGVQVPQVNTRQDALRVVDAAKFSPEGNRGVCRFVRAAGYSSKNKNEYFEESNRQNLIIIHIEGRTGIENFEEIIDVKGIDIIFLGPYDLSQSLGVPGQINHPKVIEAMKTVIARASARNKFVGTFVETPEDYRMWKDLGLIYLAYQVDTGIFYDACHKICHELKQL